MAGRSEPRKTAVRPGPASRQRAFPPFARPVCVDVDFATRDIDIGRVEAAITPCTRAVMPVHFAGLPVDMDALYSLAERRGSRVIEDPARAELMLAYRH